ncbi:MAG: hypothetical protein JWO82_594 [Akkermansiaceae bacterium]|nr:hypothetical protein [Akkermansiaceae bacterium]
MHMDSLPITRRRLIQTLFCSSMAMGLNLGKGLAAETTTSGGTLDLLLLGDFGTGSDHQKKVGGQMVSYVGGLGKKPEGMLLLGDNFYGPMPGGVECNRWQRDFSDVYPAADLPGPCYAILGNHDYHDHPGNVVELAYPAHREGKSRWTMPANYYRLDLPKDNPQATLLMLDTNWERINRRIHGEGPCWMEKADEDKQMAWLKEQLASKRAKFTIVAGHHPVYSDSAHGDTPELVAELGPLLEQHGVHLYVCGHDHDLQHMEMAGLRTSFVLSGGGGQSLSDSHEPRPGSVTFKVHGFSHLSVDGDAITVKHIDSNGGIVHAFVKKADYSWKLLA